MGVIEQVLQGGGGLPSALDVDVQALGTPEPRLSVAAVAEERRLSAFDVVDEEAEGRAYRWRRVLGVAAVALGSLAAVAGSVAIGL